MRTSKDVFKDFLTVSEEFTSSGNKWCDTNNVGDAARARSYGKKMIGYIKEFVETSLVESDNLIKAAEIAPAVVAIPEVVEVIPEPTVQEVVVEPEVVTQVVESVKEDLPVDVVEEVKPATSSYSSFKKKPYNK